MTQAERDKLLKENNDLLKAQAERQRNEDKVRAEKAYREEWDAIQDAYNSTPRSGLT